MMRRSVVIALVILLASWGAPLAVNTHGAGPSEVSIALFAPLTGSQADVGAFNKNAVQMAVDDVNAGGGIKALGGARLRLGIIRDLRTALNDNPLPVDVLRELLGKAA